MTTGLYSAVREHSFSETTCFLCGLEMDVDSTSVEHIFPQWLLNHFGLRDELVTLINGTRIPYRKMVIPCCTTCNNEHLSPIEQKVRDAVLGAPESIYGLDRIALFQWVLKIFYGFLYREIFLPFDRTQPDAGSIMTPEFMEQYQMLHYMLQSVRIPMTFRSLESDIPASIYVFELQEPPTGGSRFDYKDDIVHRTLYLRLGRIGILAAFDMGAQTVEGSIFFPKYQHFPLHPMQFAELGANLFMKARKFNRDPKLFFAEHPSGVTMNVVPIAGLSFQPVFLDIEVEEMAEMLSFFLDVPLGEIMSKDGGRVTLLRNADGSRRFIDVQADVVTTD